MKLFTRVKLVVVLSALMVMMASSAWAAYTKTINVTLNSTGEQLTVQATYLRDGAEFSMYEGLSDTQMEEWGKKANMMIVIFPNGSSEELRLISTRGVEINQYGEKATFSFPHEEGVYIFRHVSGPSLDYNDDFPTDEDQIAFYENLMGAATFQKMIERFEEYNPDNGFIFEQTVTIKKDTTPPSPTPPSSSSGGCNAGFGVVGLLLAGLAVLKYRKK